MVKANFPEPFNFVKLIKGLIEKAINERNIGASVWIVTSITSRENDGYITDYRANIKHLDFKFSLDNVPMAGIGLGNMKGVLKYPDVGDFVLVNFQGSRPYIIGTVFNDFADPKDNIPLIKLSELAIVQKEKGSLIIMKDNNDILIKAADSLGNLNNGAKIRLNADGSFKLFNKNGYGIEVDSSGNMTLRGVTINATQSPGTW